MARAKNFKINNSVASMYLFRSRLDQARVSVLTMMLFIDYLNRHAVMYAVSGPNFKTGSTANLLMNKYIPVRSYAVSLLLGNGL